MPPGSLAGLVSIIDFALPAEAVVVVARSVSSAKLPISMPHESVHFTARSCLTSLIALRNGWILAPWGSVLNFSASVAIVISDPPAALDRSEITGTGVKIVSMIGWSGLVASTTCCR